MTISDAIISSVVIICSETASGKKISYSLSKFVKLGLEVERAGLCFKNNIWKTNLLYSSVV